MRLAVPLSWAAIVIVIAFGAGLWVGLVAPHLDSYPKPYRAFKARRRYKKRGRR